MTTCFTNKNRLRLQRKQAKLRDFRLFINFLEAPIIKIGAFILGRKIMTQYLSFDIGGTNLKYAIINKEGHILEKGHVKSSKNLDAFLKSMYQVADHYQGKFDGIAVCAPGKIDVKNKIIHFGGALPFLDGLNLQKTLGDKYHVPIGTENDGKAAALCEQWLGQLHNVNTGAVMTLGTGVGGGILIDNRVLHGKDFQAGELSWMITNSAAGIKSMDAYTGANCSAVGMITKVNKALGNQDLTDGLAAFKAINAHNEEVYPIFEDFCKNIAIMILNVQTVINGEKIVIGGGISSQPIVLQEINYQFNLILQDIQC